MRFLIDTIYALSHTYPIDNEQGGAGMKLTQNHIEHLQDLMQRGLLTADQANVEKVKMARVQLVQGRLPAQVRKALNAAVKSGELGHVKKQGKKPEAYFHPTFEHLANSERSRCERETLAALSGVVA